MHIFNTKLNWQSYKIIILMFRVIFYKITYMRKIHCQNKTKYIHPYYDIFSSHSSYLRIFDTYYFYYFHTCHTVVREKFTAVKQQARQRPFIVISNDYIAIFRNFSIFFAPNEKVKEAREKAREKKNKSDTMKNLKK